MTERVDIKVGFYCNNQCKFCVQGRKRDYLPAKDKKEVIDSLAEAYGKGKREVVFTGGEPCLHPEFLFLVKSARDLGFETIQIQSNGRMFAYKDYCVKLINAGANQFSPSVHGCCEDIHDFLTEAPGSFKQTIQGIKNLKSLNQYVLINSVITSSNYQTMPELASLLVSLGVDQFQFAFVHILGTADKNKEWIVPRKSEIMEFVKKGLSIGLEACKRVSTEAIPYCFMNGYEACVAEERMPNTRIYDAGFVVEDYGEYRMNSGKGKVKREECRACKYFKICEGPWREYVDIYGWEEFVPIR